VNSGSDVRVIILPAHNVRPGSIWIWGAWNWNAVATTSSDNGNTSFCIDCDDIEHVIIIVSAHHHPLSCHMEFNLLYVRGDLSTYILRDDSLMYILSDEKSAKTT